MDKIKTENQRNINRAVANELVRIVLFVLYYILHIVLGIGLFVGAFYISKLSIIAIFASDTVYGRVVFWIAVVQIRIFKFSYQNSAVFLIFAAFLKFLSQSWRIFVWEVGKNLFGKMAGWVFGNLAKFEDLSRKTCVCRKKAVPLQPVFQNIENKKRI